MLVSGNEPAARTVMSCRCSWPNQRPLDQFGTPPQHTHVKRRVVCHQRVVSNESQDDRQRLVHLRCTIHVARANAMNSDVSFVEPVVWVWRLNQGRHRLGNLAVAHAN